MTIDIYNDNFRLAMGSIQKRAELEKIEKVVESFVNQKIFENIAIPESQLIRGRRGTGKSHILLFYCEQCRINFETNRIIPCYISMENAFMDLKGKSITEPQLATYLFNYLLILISKQLYAFTKKVISPSLFEKITSTGGKNKLKKVKVQIQKLEELATYGSPLYRKGKTFNQDRKSKARTRKSSLSYKAAAKSKSLDVGIGLSDKHAGKWNSKDQTNRISSGILILKASEVIECLEEMVEILESKYLFIFLDQWSDTLSSSVQPYFADLVKHILLSSPKIRLKIAITPTNENLYNRSVGLGFELGRDIFVGVNLDEKLLFVENKKLPVNFYSAILKKHIEVSYPEIKNLELSNQAIIELLFENTNVFEQAIIASGGIIRDFIIIVTKAYNNLIREFGMGLINQGLISDAASRYTLEKISDISKDKYYKKVYDKFISSAVFQKKMPTFLMPFSNYSIEVDYLVNARLLHEVPAKVLAPGIQGTYKAFLLDQGLLIMNNIHLDSESFFFETFQIQQTEAERRFIYQKTLSSESFRIHFPSPPIKTECPICEENFYKNHKLYRKYGICPKCHNIADQAKFHKSE